MNQDVKYETLYDEFNSHQNILRVQFNSQLPQLTIYTNNKYHRKVNKPELIHTDFKTLHEAYQFLSGLKKDQYFISNQFLLIFYKDSLIPVQLNKSQCYFYKDSHPQVYDFKDNRIISKEFSLKSKGYNSNDIEKKGNCICMLISILKVKGEKKLQVVMRDLYLFSFNTGIVADSKIFIEDKTQIVYSFALVPSFLSNRYEEKGSMVQYGKVISFGFQYNRDICIVQLQLSNLFCKDVGYFQLTWDSHSKQVEIKDCFTISHQNPENQKRYNLKYWHYQAWVQKYSKKQSYLYINKQSNLQYRLVIPGHLKKLISIYFGKAQLLDRQKIVQLKESGLSYWIQRLREFYLKILQKNVAILNFNKKRESDQSVDSYRNLLKQRQYIYYQLFNYEQVYLSGLILDINQKKEFQIQKIKTLKQISKKQLLFKNLFPDLVTFKNRIYKDSSQFQDLCILKVLQPQPQLYFQSLYNTMKLLEKKKLVVQFYLLRHFYFLFNQKMSEMRIQRLLDISNLISQNNQSIGIQVQSQFIIDLKNRKAPLRFQSKLYQGYKLQNLSSLRISYEDEVYCYYLYMDNYLQVEIPKLLSLTKKQNLNELLQQLNSSKNSLELFALEGFVYFYDKQHQFSLLMQLKRFKKPQYIGRTKIRLIQVDQSLNETAASKIPRKWKSFNDQQSAKATLFQVFQSNKNRQYKIKQKKSHFIAFNCLITEFEEEPDWSLISSMAVIMKEQSKQYFKVLEWSYIKNNRNWVGLVQKNNISYIGYSQKLFHESDIQIDFEMPKHSFRVFKQKQNHYLLPDQEQTGGLRKCLSALSSCQLFPEVIQDYKLKASNVVKIFEDLASYEKLQETNQKFELFLKDNNSKEFMDKRWNAIQKYKQMLKNYEQMSSLIQNFKKYSMDKDENKVFTDIIQGALQKIKHQDCFNKKSIIQLLRSDSNQIKKKKQTIIQMFYESRSKMNQKIAEQYEKLLEYIEELDKKDCYLQFYDMLTKMQGMLTGQDKSYSHSQMHMIGSKTTKKLDEDIKIKNNYELVKVKYHSVLNSNFQQKIQIDGMNDSYQNFHSKLSKLYQKQILFNHYSSQILNQPIPVDVLQKSKLIIQSWKKLAGFYNQNKQKIQLKAQQIFMMHMSNYYDALQLNFPQYHFVLLDSYQKNANNSSLINNNNNKQNTLTLEQQQIQLSSQILVRHQLQNGLIQKVIQKQFKDERQAEQSLFDSFHSLVQDQDIQITNMRKAAVQKKRIKIFVTCIRDLYSQRINKARSKKEKRSIRKRIFISFNYFEPRFNFKFPPINNGQKKKIERRGGLPFYQPSSSIKLALKVCGKYMDRGIQERQNLWLSKHNEPDSWAVAYHGVGQPFKIIEQDSKMISITQNIIKQGLRVGPRQKFENWKCIFHKDCILQQGVYLTPHFKTALGYSRVNQISQQIQQQGEKEEEKERINSNYSIVFMTRVKTSEIHACQMKLKGEDYKRNDYWIVNPKFIRPYAIILTKDSVSKSYPLPNEEFGEKFQFSKYKNELKKWYKKKQQTKNSKKIQESKESCQMF